MLGPEVDKALSDAMLLQYSSITSSDLDKLALLHEWYRQLPRNAPARMEDVLYLIVLANKAILENQSLKRKVKDFAGQIIKSKIDRVNFGRVL